MQAGPLTPDLPTLGYLIETLNEGLVDTLEVLRFLAPRVLELDEGRPEAASGVMDLQGVNYHVLRFLEVAVPQLQHYSLEEDLPFALNEPLGLIHDLPGSVDLTFDLEELGILYQCKRHLLGGYIDQASLD